MSNLTPEKESLINDINKLYLQIMKLQNIDFRTEILLVGQDKIENSNKYLYYDKIDGVKYYSKRNSRYKMPRHNVRPYRKIATIKPPKLITYTSKYYDLDNMPLLKLKNIKNALQIIKNTLENKNSQTKKGEKNE